MGIYISTNLFRPRDLENIFPLVDKVKEALKLEKIEDEKVGIELFPEWQSEIFEEVLRGNLEKFKSYNISLHGPYYKTEHSEKCGTEGYDRAIDYFTRTLQLSKDLKSEYIVYHHNNCKITNKDKREIIKVSSENLLELNKLSKEYDANIIVENAGVKFNDNMLFDEDEFIDMAKSIDNTILIDIGHAFANGWNLERVIKELKDKIVSYHLHNNNGINDSHDLITNGKLNMDEFMKLYKEYTPKADLVIEYGAHCANAINNIVEDIIWCIKNK